MKRMTGFREKGSTILFVSHSMDEIKRLCDRVIWLDHGKQKMYGDPKSVTEEYQKA